MTLFEDVRWNDRPHTTQPLFTPHILIYEYTINIYRVERDTLNNTIKLYLKKHCDLKTRV